MQVEHSKELLSYEEMNKLTERVGWGKNWYKSPAIWQKVLLSSSYIAYIKIDNEIVAFGRIVEDGLMCMLYDICVHPAYQRQGLGSQIVKSLLAIIKDNDYVNTGLFVWPGNPDAKDFYQSLGFKESVAMQL